MNLNFRLFIVFHKKVRDSNAPLSNLCKIFQNTFFHPNTLSYFTIHGAKNEQNNHFQLYGLEHVFLRNAKDPVKIAWIPLRLNNHKCLYPRERGQPSDFS